MQRTFRYYSPGDIQANYRPRQAYGQFSTNHELEKVVRALPRVQGFGKVDILLHDANGNPTDMHVGTASVPDGIPVLEVRQILGRGAPQRKFRYFCPGDDQANTKPRQAYAMFSTLEGLEQAVRSQPKVQGLGTVEVLLHDVDGSPMSIPSNTVIPPSSTPVLEVRLITGAQQRSMSSPVQTGSSRDRFSQAMARFAMACAADNVREAVKSLNANSVILLEKGAVWLGIEEIASNALFVRPCYPELLDAIDAYTLKRPELKKGEVIVTGTTGVGKSHLCGLQVARLLASGSSVVLELHSVLNADYEPRQFLLSPQGDSNEFSTTAAARKELLARSNIAYVVDGGCPKIPLKGFSGARFIFATPSRELLKASTMVFNVLVLYMPTADFKELKRCKDELPQYRGIDNDLLLEWYMTAGGVLRTCLERGLAGSPEGPSDWLQEVQQILRLASYSDLMEMATKMSCYDKSLYGSDRIFHWVPPEHPSDPMPSSPSDPKLRRYASRICKFASDRVGQEAIRILQDSWIKRAAFACMDSRADQAATAGYWLQWLALSHMRAGSKVTCKFVYPRSSNKKPKPMVIKLPPMEVDYYHTTHQAAARLSNDCNRLLLPRDAGQTAMDGIIGPAFCMQLNVAKPIAMLKHLVTKLVTTMLARDSRAKINKVAVPTGVGNLELPLHAFIVLPSAYDSYNMAESYTSPFKSVYASQEPLGQQLVIRLPLDEIFYSNPRSLQNHRDATKKQNFKDALRRISEINDPQGLASKALP